MTICWSALGVGKPSLFGIAAAEADPRKANADTMDVIASIVAKRKEKINGVDIGDGRDRCLASTTALGDARLEFIYLHLFHLQSSAVKISSAFKCFTNGRISRISDSKTCQRVRREPSLAVAPSFVSGEAAPRGSSERDCGKKCCFQ